MLKGKSFPRPKSLFEAISHFGPKVWKPISLLSNFRARSTTTRDRNLQFRGAVSIDFLLSFPQWIFSLCLQVLCVQFSQEVGNCSTFRCTDTKIFEFAALLRAQSTTTLEFAALLGARSAKNPGNCSTFSLEIYRLIYVFKIPEQHTLT